MANNILSNYFSTISCRKGILSAEGELFLEKSPDYGGGVEQSNKGRQWWGRRGERRNDSTLNSTQKGGSVEGESAEGGSVEGGSNEELLKFWGLLEAITELKGVNSGIYR